MIHTSSGCRSAASARSVNTWSSVAVPERSTPLPISIDPHTGWAWTSMRPGRTVAPSKVWTIVPGPRSGSRSEAVPTAVMRPSVTATAFAAVPAASSDSVSM